MSQSPLNHPNNQRFCELVAAARLSEATAITLFNRARHTPVTVTAWRSWLAQPGSDRWAAMHDADLRHAEAAIAPMSIIPIPHLSVLPRADVSADNFSSSN